MTESRVKRLVSLYDVPTSASLSSKPPLQSNDDLRIHDFAGTSSVSAPPARFLSRPSSRPSEGLPNDTLASSMARNSDTLQGYSTGVDTPGETTADVADELGTGKLHFREGSRTARIKNWLLDGSKKIPGSTHHEEQFLLANVSLGAEDSEHNPQTIVARAEPLMTSAATVASHDPVPASVVFSSKAAPLHLPHLDEYISSLPMPSFTFPYSNGKGKEASMFIPMGQLVASGKTIEDLELNSVMRPAWRNRNSIFGVIVSIVLGITVRLSMLFLCSIVLIYMLQGSSALATFYSLQGLFNTVQIFALILSTLGKSPFTDCRLC